MRKSRRWVVIMPSVALLACGGGFTARVVGGIAFAQAMPPSTSTKAKPPTKPQRSTPQTAPKQTPSQPSAQPVPVLVEYPFQKLEKGEGDGFVVKVPVPIFKLDRGNEIKPPILNRDDLVRAQLDQAIEEPVRALNKGGICVYDNPSVPIDTAGIGWLSTEGKYLTDGTALVNLRLQKRRTAPTQIQSSRSSLPDLPEVDITRVRCVPAQFIDTSSLRAEAAKFRQELDKNLLAAALMIEGIKNGFANIVQDERVTAVSRIVGSAAVALETVVTRDTVDAFTAKRQVGYTLRAPRDYVRWRARIDAEPMRAYCKLKVGAAGKGFTVDIDKDSHSFEHEVDSSDRGAVSFECGVVSRGAWSREVLAAEGAAEAERAGAADASLAAVARVRRVGTQPRQ